MQAKSHRRFDSNKTEMLPALKSPVEQHIHRAIQRQN
jgi:hypothetical protein